jgi:hypothetical protein
MRAIPRVVFIGVLLLTGCQTAKEAKNEALFATELTTMAALSPLVPVVAAYHAVSGD